ncbi:hypothetical protein AYI69_g3140 [Smittium culicis]|uniref:Uncharacterized protein n=1 Tax=Smittium culicis TaxID=133412 RepID=A0A1R1YKH8_9FUNG|nr:hypothetical protein AYI69_g3140 [Smittium culicis]
MTMLHITAIWKTYIVSGSSEANNLLAATDTSNHSNTRPKKRKFAAVEQQKLVSYSIENQRIFLKVQGLLDTVIDNIVSKQRAVKSRSR